MKKIIDEILNSHNMLDSTKSIVESHSHDFNVELYYALTDEFFEMSDNDPRFDILNDILDGLSGHCHTKCRIGDGNYAW